MEETHVEGTLERLIQMYKRGEFSVSKVYMKEEKTEKQKEFNFYGLVPESLIGKKITYSEKYFSGGYIQQIIYKENSSEYILISDGIKS